MLNKTYDKIFKIVKTLNLYLIGFSIAFLLMTIKLPYYINTPGGIIDIKNKIEIDNYSIKENSFNMAYVSEIRATIPTFLYSYLNKNWDLIKKKEHVPTNETEKETKFRDQVMLNESNQEAIILAYTKANQEITIIDKHLYITYIEEGAKTDLKIGDEILKINNLKITDLEDVKKAKETFIENQEIIIKVKSINNKIINRKATIFKEKDNLLIGVLISIDYELETKPEIKLKYKDTDGGPSGGFMISLAIYDTLTGSKLNNDQKIVGTGTIDSEGNVGEVGGVKYKIKGAEKKKADIFFVPAGDNYEEVMAIKIEKNYKIKVIPIKTLDDAIAYLEKEKK